VTSDEAAGTRVQGSLRSAADGTGIVHMEARFDTGIDEVWSALTDPGRLARRIGEVEGDVRLGGEFYRRFFASGAEGTGRVDACEPSRRLLVTLDPDQPDEGVIEVMLAPDGEGTLLVREERGCPWTSSPPTGRGSRSMSKISLPTSPGVSSATPTCGGTSSNPPMKFWRPTSANYR
jgi:uncharacterized protein YndB with AHSA1/START domain